eukprot:1028334-Pelagomonas_calceolata.AAC.2
MSIDLLDDVMQCKRAKQASPVGIGTQHQEALPKGLATEKHIKRARQAKGVLPKQASVDHQGITLLPAWLIPCAPMLREQAGSFCVHQSCVNKLAHSICINVA